MNGVVPVKNVASANVGLKAICAFEHLCNMNGVIRAGFALSKMCPGLKAICAFDTGSVLLQNQKDQIA
ncbi:hypothetical protein D5086_031756 [Populus alba]|uniref:Uncharacterized protein n=1 Tax=Populus alba TaxID=43335 RepID=A0ACC4AJG2_POPAL